MKREAGILLHITSLPGKYGAGDLGKEAFQFVNLLNQAGQSYWQILPINPLNSYKAYSPYTPLSAFAGNTMLINPDELYEKGLLKRLPQHKHYNSGSKADYAFSENLKQKIIGEAYEFYCKNNDDDIKKGFKKFCSQEAHWLDDWSLFLTLRKQQEKPWNAWSKDLRERNSDVLEQVAKENHHQIEQEKFAQFLFKIQWNQLKEECRKCKVKLLGDIPIYVGFDSADVWANQEYFKLTKNGSMAKIAGVPPDYFNSAGQLWNMPVYNWKALENNNFDWWVRRVRKNLELFDTVRLDHFRGFSSYWEVKGADKNAIDGKWVKGPGSKLFDVLNTEFPEMPFIAEDLGDIDQPVLDLRDKYKLPGMRVLQFAFEGSLSTSGFLPHNYINNAVVYTGTHDNNTLLGWYSNELKRKTKTYISKYLAKLINKNNCTKELIHEVYKSVARLAIIPMQDILNLGEKNRMNVPSTKEGNWLWRMKKNQFNLRIAKRLKAKAELFNRLPD